MAEEKKIEITHSELRSLLFWATIGVQNKTGGSYRNISEIILKYAKLLKFHLPSQPYFLTREQFNLRKKLRRCCSSVRQTNMGSTSSIIV
jgi:hypothetical protein